MRTSLSTLLLLAVVVTPAVAQTSSDPAPASAPRLAITPTHPDGGALVRVTVEGLPASDAPSLTGRMAGEPLHFVVDPSGTARAIGAVPTDVTDSLVARVEVRYASGRSDTLRTALVFPPEPPPPPSPRSRSTSRLKVDPKFSRTTAAINARIARENARAREIGRRAHDTPQLWTQPFERPRPSRITSRFGSGRLFNGRVTSRHGGVDFAGARGAPVKAANRGVVALVDTFYLAGNVVYIDHGAGVVTGYFHLSRIDVAPGDTVERGQQIGLVGATGRVTGPHLHWNARYGAITVNALDLINVTAADERR